ncbi:MAG: ATP-dependent Clp protease ATP-binding subunit [Verrucomicrobiae bacterium]|nr:ATP-dependent Clp protease ATP-binding subunit [Verrucomicrobiae bacterium]
MRDLHIRALSITAHLEDGPAGQAQMFTELLFFPEVTTFTNKLSKAQSLQRDLASELLNAMSPEELTRRQVPADGVEPLSIVVEIEPLKAHDVAWGRPVAFRVEGLQWQQPDASIAYLPTLGIEVVAADAGALGKMVAEHVRSALVRNGALQSLFQLALLQRTQRLEIEGLTWNARPLTPGERYLKELGEESKENVLKEVAVCMLPGKMRRAYERERDVELLGSWLLGRRPMSVLLVGEAGVGKTAVIEEMIRTNTAFGAKGREMWRTSGARIVAGMSGMGDWQERCMKMIRECKDRKALLNFGNLFELLEVGQSSASTENIASFLRPWLSRGEIQAVFECTPQQLAAIEQSDPRMLDAVRQLKLEEPEPASVSAILTRVANQRADDYCQERDFSEEAIRRVESLHRRFASYSAFPGRALRFIERLREQLDPSPGQPVTAADADRAFAAETGMPSLLIDDEEMLDLTRTEKWFRDRVIGQEGAVEVAITAVAAIKARLSRPGKPLASFLFIGPTGVGKTELARTLAEFFFSDRNRMIRLDMSEFSTPGSAGRLASSSLGDAEGILTSQMRDQPFSLLLLDEFEKASPEVYDLFLQVLGEARLTDGAGRVADFSNAIIVMTSNLGAQTYTGARFGFNDGSGGGTVAIDHFTEAVKKELRPEFFNRIDRIVPFLPLEREVVRGVVKRELSLIDARDGLRNRNLAVAVEEPVVDLLVEAGYDPRYGARPVKRAIEQRLLRKLADELNASKRENGIFAADVETARNGQRITFKFHHGKDEVRADVAQRRFLLEELPRRRRAYQKLFASSMVSQLSSERSQLRRRLKNRTHVQSGTDAGDDYKRSALLDSLLGRLESERCGILDCEQTILLEEYGESSGSRADARVLSEGIYRETLIDVYSASEQASAQISLVLHADSSKNLHAFVRLYLEVAAHFGCRSRVGIFHRPPEPLPDDDELVDAKWGTMRPEVLPVDEALDSIRSKGTVAVAVEIADDHAFLRFRSEEGAHVFVDSEDNSSRAQIRAVDAVLEKCWCDIASIVNPDLNALAVRRQFDEGKGSVKDSALERKQQGVATPELVAELINENLYREAESQL